MDLTGANIQNIFGISIDSMQELQGGHINASFLVTEKNGKKSVVQRINQHVFPRWECIEVNIRYAQDLLQKSDFSDLIPHFFNQNGRIHLKHGQEIWRRMEWIVSDFKDSTTNSSNRAFRAAEAFARFSNHLSPALQKLAWKEPIPQFHHLESRIFQFKQSLKTANEERVDQAETTITAYQSAIKRIRNAVSGMEISRITHNDAKLSNVIFNPSGNAVVIDLDTLMPGNILYDLGDLIRTFVPQKPEGDFSDSRQKVQENIAEALLAGYLEGWENKLSKKEMELLPFAGPYMTFLIGIRFLTDFLENDHYFKVEMDNHNLLRAQNQMELLELLF